MHHRRPSIGRIAIAIIAIVIIVVAAVGGYEYYLSTLPKKPVLTGSITVVATEGENDIVLQKIAQQFEALHPGVTIHIVDIPFGDALQDYLTAFQANEDIYDIIYFPNTPWLGVLQPYLLNLTPYVNNPEYFPPSYNFSDIIPTMINQFKFGNTLYGIPFFGDVMLLYYRPSFFENATNQQLFEQEYGYPLPNPGDPNTTLTLQQLLDIANFFNDKHGSKYGIVFPNDATGGDMTYQLAAIMAPLRVSMDSVYGPVTPPYGVFYTSNGQLLTNTTIFREALDYLAAFENDSADEFSDTYLATPGTFGSGVAPLLWYWTPAMLALRNSSIANDWAIAANPPGGVSILGGVAYGIYKYSKNIPLAVSFLEFATSPNESIYYFTIQYLMPFRYSGMRYIVQHGLLPAQDIQLIIKYMQESVTSVPNLPYATQLITYIQAEVPYLASMKITPAQAASVITSEAESLGIPIYSGPSFALTYPLQGQFVALTFNFEGTLLYSASGFAA